MKFKSFLLLAILVISSIGCAVAAAKVKNDKKFKFIIIKDGEEIVKGGCGYVKKKAKNRCAKIMPDGGSVFESCPKTCAKFMKQKKTMKPKKRKKRKKKPKKPKKKPVKKTMKPSSASSSSDDILESIEGARNYIGIDGIVYRSIITCDTFGDEDQIDDHNDGNDNNHNNNTGTHGIVFITEVNSENKIENENRNKDADDNSNEIEENKIENETIAHFVTTNITTEVGSVLCFYTEYAIGQLSEDEGTEGAEKVIESEEGDVFLVPKNETVLKEFKDIDPDEICILSGTFNLTSVENNTIHPFPLSTSNGCEGITTNSDFVVKGQIASDGSGGIKLSFSNNSGFSYYTDEFEVTSPGLYLAFRLPEEGELSASAFFWPSLLLIPYFLLNLFAVCIINPMVIKCW